MKKNFNETDHGWTAKVNCLWNLKSTLLPVLTLIRNALPVTKEPQTLFRGVKFNSLGDLSEFISKIKCNGALTQLKSWTNSLEVALRFSKPNEGLVGRLNLMQRRMKNRGLEKEIITSHGLLLVTVVPGISVKRLAIKKSESEFWLTGRDNVVDINVARNKEEIWELLSSVEPKLAQSQIEEVSNSNRWVALLTCLPHGEDIIYNTAKKVKPHNTPLKRNGRRERIIPCQSSAKTEETRWTDIDSHTPIDFSKKPLRELDITPKPDFDIIGDSSARKKAAVQLSMSTDYELQQPRLQTCLGKFPVGPEMHSTQSMPVNTVNTCVLPENRIRTNPTVPLGVKQEQRNEYSQKLLWIGETKVAGRRFRFSKKKGSGVQKFVFNQADRMKHRVCVVLEHYGRRL